MYSKEYKYLILIIGLLLIFQNPTQSLIKLFAGQTNLHWNLIYQCFTSLFLHFNTFHLVINITILLITLGFLKYNQIKVPHLMPKMLGIGYFSNLVSIGLSFAYTIPQTYIIGLSGGIMGILGICTTMVVQKINKNNIKRPTITLSIVVLICYVLISSSIISNIIHISGFIFGAITGIISNTEKEPS